MSSDIDQNSTKTAFPFEPAWVCNVGIIRREGKGLLTKELSEIRSGIEKFTIPMGSFVLTVFPFLGRILLDSKIVLQCEPGELFWMRRMSQSIATQDKHSAAPECLWYGVGIISKGIKKGFKILSSGSVVNGDF